VNTKKLLIDKFPDCEETIEALLGSNTAFNALADEYNAVSDSLDVMSEPHDPASQASADKLRLRLNDLHEELRGLIEQSTRV